MAAEAAAARGREEGGDGGGSGGRREGEAAGTAASAAGGWGGARGRSEVGRVWHRHCVWALEPGLGQGPLRWGVGEAEGGASR